ncbi:hypothetical protein [Halorussus salinus]|uniref:hypothetical protein n=1 Tax=Halorussus salinus TaxID=1364935 RepID=UPI001092AD21|nr:hypothetical protein [Halorussus salinus]
MLEHICFVGVFGGTSNALVNKDLDRSTVEVYSNRDGNLVQFFQVLCDCEKELVEWLETVFYFFRLILNQPLIFVQQFPSQRIRADKQFKCRKNLFLDIIPWWEVILA